MTADPTSTTIADRLSSTLFMAALFHGIVILGITFTAGPLGDSDDLPTLKVTLVANTAELDSRSEDADYIAQRNQRGSGNRAVSDRPTTTLAAEQPFTQQGDPTGADLTDGTPRDPVPSAEQVVTRSWSADRLNALPEPSETPTEVPQTAAVLINNPDLQTLAAEVDLTASLPDQENRELLASPDTRESSLAGYLDSWRRRVERVGTVNFPSQAHSAPANPTLEVTIGADGQLTEIIVRRSSGNSALDQAALSILRLAAPFDPLPETIQAEYDVLRFAYEWDFEGGQGAPAID